MGPGRADNVGPWMLRDSARGACSAGRLQSVDCGVRHQYKAMALCYISETSAFLCVTE